MKKTILILIISIFTCYFLISLEGLFNDSLSGNQNRLGVIYGNKVELSGEPSQRLKSRLDIGYDLYQDKKIDKIIVSGGIGVEGFDEAKVMKEYLIEKGIDETDIFIDSLGYTTRETSENAFGLLEDGEIVGISQWFHIARVKLSLKQAGFEKVYWYAPTYFELRDIYSLFRELPAYVKYLF